MTPPGTDDAREMFDYFSNEYAEALQAFEALENQSGALTLLGRAEDFLDFVEQFIGMASRARELAIEKGEANFAEWFGELIEKGEALRSAVPRG
jgi:hypothetical protein